MKENTGGSEETLQTSDALNESRLYITSPAEFCMSPRSRRLWDWIIKFHGQQGSQTRGKYESLI